MLDEEKDSLKVLIQHGKHKRRIPLPLPKAVITNETQTKRINDASALHLHYMDECHVRMKKPQLSPHRLRYSLGMPFYKPNYSSNLFEV